LMLSASGMHVTWRSLGTCRSSTPHGSSSSNGSSLLSSSSRRRTGRRAQLPAGSCPVPAAAAAAEGQACAAACSQVSCKRGQLVSFGSDGYCRAELACTAVCEA
jgi:hypothetical protein